MKILITRAQLEKALGFGKIYYDYPKGLRHPFPETIEVEVEASCHHGNPSAFCPTLECMSKPPTPTEPVEEKKLFTPCDNKWGVVSSPQPVDPEVPKPPKKECQPWCEGFHEHVRPPKIDDSWCGNERLQELIRRENQRNGYTS